MSRIAWAALDRYLDGGQLRVGRGALPPRWSGQGGPFLLKACAYLRHGEGAVARAAQAAIPELVDQALACPHREAHPQLYAIEGLLLLGEFDPAQRPLQALLGAHGGPAGLRESIDGGGRRSDVLAQALRAALLLDADAARQSTWRTLALELAQRVDARGRLPFVPKAEHRAARQRLLDSPVAKSIRYVHHQRRPHPQRWRDARPRVLLVSPFSVLPPAHGGARRIVELARASADHLDVLLLHDEAGATPRAATPDDPCFRAIHPVGGRPDSGDDWQSRWAAHAHAALRAELDRLIELTVSVRATPYSQPLLL